MTRNEFYKNLKLNAQYLFKIDPKSWISKPNKSISVQGKLGILTVSFDRNVIVTRFTPEKGETLAKLENYNEGFAENMVANTTSLMGQLITMSNFN
jgi:hypothetical protein